MINVENSKNIFFIFYINLKENLIETIEFLINLNSVKLSIQTQAKNSKNDFFHEKKLKQRLNV